MLILWLLNQKQKHLCYGNSLELRESEPFISFMLMVIEVIEHFVLGNRVKFPSLK